ncbi:Exostosin family protein [Trichomonas vaginalis G3]|uniref:Exostosin family protein n=1 Tax=Trichomonas vaginalis (strain ATCC PRA-98 / G3) TaxID=412133 RepID=A2ETF2_TRIV3|nr:macromolecule glycosylation [Trichomonas vaginalis G3]EAY04072.1 Exostosin family protein [Trichomonas vaginalis G3]KAI5513390.1 macromolecule glycosylation [Trichomonas vaginalis G3]|eukprot:XP_001316295.1 Exostosin family protein [Trichomonas vaginalis G3]
MYDIEANNTAKLCKNLFCDYPVKKSQAHTFYFEPVLHRHFMKGYNRVSYESDADLFYVPIYLGLFNMQREKCDFDRCVLPLVRSQGDYYDRFGSVDHVFVQMLFSHNNVPFTQHHQKVIVAQTTIGDINWNLSIFEPRQMTRFTVMPYNSNFDFYESSSKQCITAFLTGQMTIASFDKRARNIRQALKEEMRNTKNTAVIETKRKSHFIAAEYFQIESLMRNSEFCPVPHGDGPQSKRLYDSMRTGCIPIVLSDEIRFPFESTFVDYKNVLIHIPQYEPQRIRDAFAVANKKLRDRMRRRHKELDRLLTVDENLDTVQGGIIWAWKWMQFFKAATIASSKRCDLLHSKYL